MHQNDQISTTVILLTAFSFIVYWFVAQSEKIKQMFYRDLPFDDASRKHIFFTKYFGFLVLGMFPIIVLWWVIPDFSLQRLGLWFNPSTAWFSVLCTLGLSVVVVPMAFVSAKKPENLKNYPQIRAKNWTNKILFINLFGWAIYLFGYELLFRGTLFFPLVETLGVWSAIAINIALYAATHIPKGLAETIGAVPLGLVLCLLTLSSETIWIAFFVHLALAWTNSLTALAYHPDIHYTGRILKKHGNN